MKIIEIIKIILILKNEENIQPILTLPIILVIFVIDIFNNVQTGKILLISQLFGLNYNCSQLWKTKGESYDPMYTF